MTTGVLITSGVSDAIVDTASTCHGAMNMSDATPLRGCSLGGRKVVLISEFSLARDVEPYFQLYSSSGSRLMTEEEMYLTQPQDQPENAISVSKETIVFITPVQEHAELILQRGWEVRLVARRKSDGLFSQKKFPFEIVPHDFYTTCIFCDLDPDKGVGGRASLVPKRAHSRPGLRKRRMSGDELTSPELSRPATTQLLPVAGPSWNFLDLSDNCVKSEGGSEDTIVTTQDPLKMTALDEEGFNV